MHAVRTLISKFFISYNSIQPAILLNSYKELNGITAINVIIGLALITLLLIRATLKLAPPRYTKLVIVAL